MEGTSSSSHLGEAPSPDDSSCSAYSSSEDSLSLHSAVDGCDDDRWDSLSDDCNVSSSFLSQDLIVTGCNAAGRAMQFSRSITSKDISYAIRGLKGM